MSQDFFAKYEEESVWTDEFIERMHALGIWGDMSLVDYLDFHAERQSDATAVRDESRALTWRELQNAVDRFAAGLQRLGVDKQDRVSLQIPNSVEWFVARLGILRAGGVVSTMLPRFRKKEMTYLMESVEPVAYIGPASYSDYSHVENAKAIQDDVPSLEHVIVDGETTVEGTMPFEDVAAADLQDFEPRNVDPHYPDRLKTSGGTTGLPKIYYWPMNTRVSHIGPIHERFGVTKYDEILALAPFPHGISTPLGCTGAFLSGATSIVTKPSNSPQTQWDLIQELEPTVVTAAPTQLNKLMKVADGSLDFLRVLFYSGEPLPNETARFYEDKGARIVSYYGSDLGGAPIAICPGDDDETRFNTVGKPVRWTEVKVLNEDGTEVGPGEVGELSWTGSAIGPGYFDDPELTDETLFQDEDGRYWFQSDDAVTLDEQGNIAIHGRTDDMILRGGENIFPSPLEDELHEHDGVSQVAVLGMPDPEYGQRICAYVVGEADLTLKDLTDFLDEQGLAKFKWPERLELVDELPKTATGKIDRGALKTDIEEKLAAE